MKTLILTIILTSGLLFSQNVRVTDYKVPISRATDLRVNGFWNWGQLGDSVSGNSASATAVFRNFYSSLPFAWFVNLDATGGKNFGSYNHNVRLDGSIRKYIWQERDWFMFSRLTAQHIDYYKQIASQLTVGTGYGRYINATALAKAVRIEEHLMREHVITGFLPKETMINIANIIERQAEYQNLYGEAYETRWFDDIEREIRLTDVMETSNIGSIGILRIRQVLFEINEKVNQRYYGWDVSTGILFKLTTFDKSNAGDPNLTINGRYSFPISWRTQINTVAEIFTPTDTEFAKELNASAGVDFIYEMSNRINFVGGYRFGFFRPSIGPNRNDNQLSASFLFYIENNIYFGMNATYEKFSRSPRRLSTSITLSYNLF